MANGGSSGKQNEMLIIASKDSRNYYLIVFPLTCTSSRQCCDTIYTLLELCM